MYKLFTSTVGQKYVVCILDNTFIPFDEQNSDYQKYLEWVAEGNTPIPAEVTE